MSEEPVCSVLFIYAQKDTFIASASDAEVGIVPESFTAEQIVM